MADVDELSIIRAKRMAELQQKMGDGSANNEQEAERRRQTEEIEANNLNQLLTPQARAKLNTFKMAKPVKAANFENQLVRMVTQGQVPGEITEESLKDLLEIMNQSKPEGGTIKYDRRRAAFDGDDGDF